MCGILNQQFYYKYNGRKCHRFLVICGGGGGFCGRGLGRFAMGEGFFVRITAASHGTWTNIHGETLALSCETKNISAIYVPACRYAYTWSHKSQYFSFLGRAANVSRWNIRPCCLGAGEKRVGYQVKEGDTEVGARMASASVNRIFLHKTGPQKQETLLLRTHPLSEN